MKEWFSNLSEQIGALPPQRQAILAVAAIGSLSFFLWIGQGMGAKEFRSLYRGLEESETARIAEALRTEKIEYRLEDAGTAILVSASEVHEARIRMAGRGLPGGSGTGLEIFDKPAFGVTDFVHRVNYARAIQGELARSIEQLDPVERARVQVVIPERSSVLASHKRKPSAAVVVRLAPGRELEPIQVRAIVHLVASSIDSLQRSDVTLVDGSGTLLAPTGDEGRGPLPPGGVARHRRQVEQELAGRIEAILEPVVGPGGIVARVSADMDWTESEVTEERFDPDSQVARSESRSEEFDSEALGDGGAAGIVANTPGEEGGGGPGASSSRKTETVNYELSKTVSHKVTAMGEVKRLSIAVLVDTTGAAPPPGSVDGAPDDGTGEPAWDAQSLQRFEQLAMQAVGFSEERGDQIVVSSAPFRAPELLPEGNVIDPALWILATQAVRVLAQLMALVLFARFVLKPLLGLLGDSAPGQGLALPAPVSALEAEFDGASGAELPAIPKVPLTLAEQVTMEAEARSDDSVTTIRNWLNQT